ncbi:hypothetical protein [Megasphaera hominis]|jgi:hypothetical protein|uniref:Uncharacterized protein n=1 Tax=Megasphaera hominis TaxID=159836 RepID=A0ABR6VEW5_9FIRM|nr:hypothetical protein [Megasphaera hominis]MBC3535676.1 hypothetical protein [Megasphaera hominis]
MKKFTMLASSGAAGTAFLSSAAETASGAAPLCNGICGTCGGGCVIAIAAVAWMGATAFYKKKHKEGDADHE